jgi:hypothetical protein
MGGAPARRLCGTALAALAALCAGLQDAKPAVSVVHGLEGGDLALVTPAFQWADAAASVDGLRLVRFNEAWCERCAGPAKDESRLGNGTALWQGSYNEPCFACGYERIAKWSHAQGAAALLWFSYLDAGHEARVVHSFAVAGELAPLGLVAVEVPEESCAAVNAALAGGRELTVDVRAGANPWLAFYGSGFMVTRVVIMVVTFSVLLLGLQRLAHFAPRTLLEGKQYTATCVLLLEVLCNLLRGVYTAVDPFFSYYVLPYGLSRVLLTITVSVELVATVAIILAWDDMLRATYMGKSAFLSPHSKQLFFTVAVVLMGTDIVFSFLAAFEGLVTLSFALGAVFTVFTIAVAVGILVVGRRLIVQLNMFTSNGASSSGADASERSDADDTGGSMAHSSTKEMTSVGGAAGLGSSMADGELPEMTAKIADAAAPSRAGSLFGKATSKLSKPSKKGRRKARADVRYMTNKILGLAIVLLFSAVALFLSSQNFVLFRSTPRAVGFGVLYCLLATGSFLRITFFVVR